MAFIDYYKILGVDKNIPQKDVRAAYKKRAKQFHPDLHPNDPKAKAKFQALNEAFDVIGDPEKRKKYDQYGARWKEMDQAQSAGGFGGFGGGGSPFDGFDFSSFTSGSGGFSSFFQELFGGGRSRAQRRQTSPVDLNTNVSVNLDLYTALLGGEIIVQVAGGSKLKLKVKPETQSGTKVRLRGKGRSLPDGTQGDMIITYNVVLPTHLTERQKSLLMQMRSS
ncbi:MAG: J domain-containing protein [Prevotella sp.]|nr:J domain-containing protein [Prevotella sp.]MDY6248138.1 DnaJ domain-containing protein [Prevotella sp.]